MLWLYSLQLSNGPVVSRKRPSEGNYEKEKEHCIALFDQWSEADQVEFVERLISRMCHYQHGHINSYLKPMLQRDFITALPGKTTDVKVISTNYSLPPDLIESYYLAANSVFFFFCILVHFSSRFRPHSREHPFFSGCALAVLSRTGL